MTNVSVMLLAAGLGTRLWPYTDTFPKCLMPIHGTPLLGIWLDMLNKADIDDIIINTHHHAEMVKAFVNGKNQNRKLRLTYEPQLLGTAGTLLANIDMYRNETIMLVHADNLSSFDVAAFCAAHKARPKNTVITMMTFDTDAPQSCGIIEHDHQGVVTAFHEKQPSPPGVRANGAVYLMNKSFLSELKTINPAITDFSTQVLPNLINKIATWHNDRYHRDIGTPESYQKALNEWRY